MAIGAIPGLQQLWAETLGHPDICLAILDGPVDQSHPSLAAANLTHVETLVPNVPDRGPASHHGIHVASIIFGQHGGPVKGIAPRCRGLVVPIFKDGTDGSITPCSQLDLARAITQAVEAGADVINISGGELTPSGAAHPILADAVQACADRNVLIVAAAGNEGCECLHVPGALPSVLAVGAMDNQGSPLGFSNWGAQYGIQGILAPGENIVGASPDGGASAQSGTSYATPIVSGIAGLLLSLQLKLGQESNPQAVRTAILESAYACDPKAISDCRPFMVGSLNIPGAHSLVTKEHRGGSAAQPAEGSQPEVMPSDNRLSLSGADSMLKTGDAAPDFSVQDHTGRDVRLSDYRGKTVVLWFYPEADTPG
jgi:cyanobactin maturation PatA/PatG family protease